MTASFRDIAQRRRFLHAGVAFGRPFQSPFSVR